MLAIDVIESKGFRLDQKTKSQVLDLVTVSWNTRDINYQLKSIAFVTSETEMRPDLVSLLYQNDQSRVGSLLKLNNISNPLSVKMGEILAVPTDEMTNNLFQSGKNITNQKQKARSFRKELQEKISQISQERLNYLNSKNISNLAQTPLPPNLLQEGQQQILVEDGKLLFGPDIGQCKTKAKKSVSVTDIKTKLAQKNIFRR
jgi:hypothetical protein